MAGKWFSAALNAARSLQPKGNTEQMLNTLRKQPGVKKEEMDFLNLDQLFSRQEVITAEDLQRAIRNRFRAEGMMHRSPDGEYLSPIQSQYSGHRPGSELGVRWSQSDELKYEDIGDIYDKLEEDGLIRVVKRDDGDNWHFINPETGEGFGFGMIGPDEDDAAGAFTMLMENLVNNKELSKLEDWFGEGYRYDGILNKLGVDVAEKKRLQGTRGFTGYAKYPEYSPLGMSPESNYIERVLAAGDKDNPLHGVSYPHYQSSGAPQIGHSRGGSAVLENAPDIGNASGDLYLVDEVQSDLFQAAAKQSKKNQETVDQLFSEVSVDMESPVVKDALNRHHALKTNLERLPYNKSWPDLLMKDQLQEAAARDADFFGYTAGSEQLDRYAGTAGPGLADFYDQKLRNSKFWKQVGLDKPVPGYAVASDLGDHAEIQTWVSRLPREVKERIRKEGLPLFSLGALATYGPYENQGALYE